MFVHISSKIMFRPVEEKKIVERELPKSRPKRIKEESKRASINEIIRTGKRLIKPPPRSQHERIRHNRALRGCSTSSFTNRPKLSIMGKRGRPTIHYRNVSRSSPLQETDDSSAGVVRKISNREQSRSRNEPGSVIQRFAFDENRPPLHPVEKLPESGL
jgi:hypothetical protein